jgi:diguanylate cyclase (GGDEF)-like protein
VLKRSPDRSDDVCMDVLAADRLRAIIDTQNEIAASSLDLEAVMALVVRRAQELVGAGDEVVYHVASGTAEPYVWVRLKAAASLSGLCVAHDEVLYCEDAARDPRVELEACERVGAMSLACAPLRHAGKVVGVLEVYDPGTRAFDQADIHTLSLLSGVIAAHVAHASEYQHELYAIRHDLLTGLANRRSFDARLAAEGARVRRHGGGVAVCLMDLDGFKRVNDTLGHAAGDGVLRAVAAHLGEVRGEDAAYRIGGDEFAMILVEAGEEGAAVAALRVADAVRADPACQGVSVSFGVAHIDADDPRDAVARADAAMYDAKRTSSS